MNDRSTPDDERRRRNEASWDFQVRRPWWRRLGGRVALALLIAAGIAAVIYFTPY